MRELEAAAAAGRRDASAWQTSLPRRTARGSCRAESSASAAILVVELLDHEILREFAGCDEMSGLVATRFHRGAEDIVRPARRRVNQV